MQHRCEMTNITFYKTKAGAYKGFTCNGHAGYADYGQDIVCASISVLVINTINALEQLAGAKMDVETEEQSGSIQCFFTAEPLSEKSEILLDTLVLGLSQIEKQYGRKHCKLKFEEV